MPQRPANRAAEGSADDEAPEDGEAINTVDAPLQGLGHGTLAHTVVDVVPQMKA